MGQYIYADQKASVIAINATFCSINAVILVIRYFTRWRLIKEIGADDILTGISALFIYSGSILTCIMTKYGLGVHYKDITPSDLKTYLKLDYFVVMAYEMSLMFVKLSLLAFYLRIAPFYQRKFRWPVFFMMVVVALLGFASILMNLLICKPIRYIWDYTIPGHCINLTGWIWASASLNFATDLIVYIFPFSCLWDLKISKRHKLGLGGLFSLGGIALVASIIRLSTLKHFQNATTDFTWDTVLPINWGNVEVHLALFVGCAPSVTSFLRRYRPSWLGEIVNKASGKGSSKSASKESSKNGTFIEPGTVRARSNGDIEMNQEIPSPDIDTDHDEAEIAHSAYMNDETKGGGSVTKSSSITSFHTAQKPAAAM